MSKAVNGYTEAAGAAAAGGLYAAVNDRYASQRAPTSASVVHTIEPEPWIEIVEQPKQADLRFRYKCEGRSAGSLLGEHSNDSNKTYPTIRIRNFDGSTAIVVVSCVSVEEPHWPHPHNLVGTDCKEGVCTTRVKGLKDISFSNIGIQCVTKKEVPDSLKLRKNLQVNPYGVNPPGDISTIDLTSVRLCFQVFLPDANRKFSRIVPPVVTRPIHDKKAVHKLTICRISRQSSYAQGGDEVFLLCEKINREDIQVRIFEMDAEGEIVWDALGVFTPQQDVHHQYAIVFLTPPYRDEGIQSSVQVFIQLRRPSDDSTSEPVPFQYIPVESDPYQIDSKRRRLASGWTDSSFGCIPTTVHPFTERDADDDVDDARDAAGSSNLKQNLKRKVERRMQKKELASAAAGAASAAPTLTQDSLDLTGGMLNVGVDFGVASAGSHPLVQGSDGSYYALVATNEGPQFVKLADIGSATDVHPASAVDLSNSG